MEGLSSIDPELRPNAFFIFFMTYKRERLLLLIAVAIASGTRWLRQFISLGTAFDKKGQDKEGEHKGGRCQYKNDFHQ
jgi:hypothetical protein